MNPNEQPAMYRIRAFYPEERQLWDGPDVYFGDLLETLSVLDALLTSDSLLSVGHAVRRIEVMRIGVVIQAEQRAIAAEL